MKKALLAALVLMGGAGVALFLARRGKAPVAPVATPIDAGTAEASTLFVARTEPPSIWRVFASGKLERLDIAVDPEIIEAPEGSSLPQVSPDGKQVALVRGNSAVMRHIASGIEASLPLRKKPVIVAWSPDSKKVLLFTDRYEVGGPGLSGPFEPPGAILAWLPDGSLLLDEAPRAQLAAKRLLRWNIGKAAEPIGLPEGYYGQFHVGRSGRFVAAAVVDAIGNQPRIVRFNLQKGVLDTVTVVGDYQWPRLSPDEQQVAFLHANEIWLRDHKVIAPAQQLVNYDWIDDQTLVVETPGELIVVGTDRQVRGRASVVARDGGP